MTGVQTCALPISVHRLSIPGSMSQSSKYYSFMFHFILNRYEYAVLVYLCIISLAECNFRKVGICNRCLLLGLQHMTRAPSLSLCSLNEFPVPLLSPPLMLPSYQHFNKVFSLETVKQFSLYPIPLLCMALSFSISSWSYFFFPQNVIYTVSSISSLPTSCSLTSTSVAPWEFSGYGHVGCLLLEYAMPLKSHPKQDASLSCRTMCPPLISFPHLLSHTVHHGA